MGWFQVHYLYHTRLKLTAKTPWKNGWHWNNDIRFSCPLAGVGLISVEFAVSFRVVLSFREATVDTPQTTRTFGVIMGFIGHHPQNTAHKKKQGNGTLQNLHTFICSVWSPSKIGNLMISPAVFSLSSRFDPCLTCKGGILRVARVSAHCRVPLANLHLLKLIIAPETLSSQKETN